MRVGPRFVEGPEGQYTCADAVEQRALTQDLLGTAQKLNASVEALAALGAWLRIRREGLSPPASNPDQAEVAFFRSGLVLSSTGAAAARTSRANSC